MSRRLTVITELIAPYRIPVFNALARLNGINLHVIFLAENDPAQRQWLVYKDEIHFSCQVLPSWRWRVGSNHLLFNWGLVQALRQAAPDAILCGGYNYPAAWRALFWAGRSHVPFLLWAESNTRDFRRGRAEIEFLKTRFLRHCDGFVVPGESSFEYLSKYGARKETIFTAPNAVDTQFFAQRAEQVGADATARSRFNLPARFFLFVGRLMDGKGVFDLLHAYQTLPAKLREEIGLVFVGDGAARSGLGRLAAKINSGVVHFAGFVQREDLPVYYGLADALVFPTHTDAWGLVVNEAMACGLPVICSRAAGCAEDLVRDHWNGRLVCPGDTEGLASAMQELGRDASLRSIMGARSKEQIAAYSPEACAAGMAAAVLSRGDPAHG
jgi:glycosyltransferase involved in cell wall biosynthesis